MEKKKVRTEDGTWLHASYKSGRYEKWKQKQKLRYWETNDNNEEIPASKSTKRREVSFFLFHFSFHQ